MITPEMGVEVMFGGKKYTLLEPGPSGPNVVWLAIETDSLNAKPRLLVIADCKPAE